MSICVVFALLVLFVLISDSYKKHTVLHDVCLAYHHKWQNIEQCFDNSFCLKARLFRLFFQICQNLKSERFESRINGKFT